MYASLLTPRHLRSSTTPAFARGRALRCAGVGVAVGTVPASAWSLAGRSLDEIPRDILAAVPLDPFDGQPLKYVTPAGRGHHLFGRVRRAGRRRQHQQTRSRRTPAWTSGSGCLTRASAGCRRCRRGRAARSSFDPNRGVRPVDRKNSVRRRGWLTTVNTITKARIEKANAAAGDSAQTTHGPPSLLPLCR